MKLGLFAIASLLMSATIHAAGFWLNPDQEGDALLKLGDAKSAASAYSDPQLKGYAQLLSGDYRAAAKTLARLHEGEASYNLGNALAHTGDLEGALSAYDEALRKNPNDRDAKHNRDLVADALKRQPQKQSGGSQKQKDSSGEGKQGNQKKNSQKHDAKNGASDKPQKGDDQPPDQNENPSGHGEKMPKPSAGQVKPVDDARTSELQIEKDQWLHSIPDDPGGLLRRKFLIEHMMRQQEQ